MLFISLGLYFFILFISIFLFLKENSREKKTFHLLIGALLFLSIFTNAYLFYSFFSFANSFILFAAFFFATSEITLRLFIRPIKPPEKVYRFHPFKAFETMPNSIRQNGIRHNNFGFRGPDINIKKPTDVTRFFMLGGSTTYDMAGPDGNHTGDFLNRELSLAHPIRKFEVINAGVANYNSLQSVINAVSHIIDFRPDIIIFMHGINDAALRLLDDYRTDYSSHNIPFIYPKPKLWEKLASLSLLFSYRTNYDNPWFPAKITCLEEFSVNPDLIKKHFKNKQVILDEESPGNLNHNSSYAFKRNILSMIALSKVHGFKLLLCTLPFSLPREKDRGRATAEHNNIVRELATQYELPLVDLDSFFSSQKDLFLDDMHMTIKGQELKAEKIAKTISSII